MDAERRIENEARSNDGFFWIDALPAAQRREQYARLQSGDILIQRIPISKQAPDALLHAWQGLIFFPGASLQQTLNLLQDYDRYHEIYAPDVVRSKLLRREGDSFQVFLRIRRKKVITVTLDTEYAVQYTRLGPDHAYKRSRSTRIAEVEAPGQPGERERPVGNDGGYMWRLNAYWRFHQTPQGTFAQCDSISLSRRIPPGLGWLVGPFVESVPRESLRFTLEATRRELASH